MIKGRPVRLTNEGTRDLIKDVMVVLIRDLPVVSTSEKEISTRDKMMGWVLIKGKTVVLIRGSLWAPPLTKGHPTP